jgi:hypothetical protein
MVSSVSCLISSSCFYNVGDLNDCLGVRIVGLFAVVATRDRPGRKRALAVRLGIKFRRLFSRILAAELNEFLVSILDGDFTLRRLESHSIYLYFTVVFASVDDCSVSKAICCYN